MQDLTVNLQRAADRTASAQCSKEEGRPSRTLVGQLFRYLCGITGLGSQKLRIS